MWHCELAWKFESIDMNFMKFYFRWKNSSVNIQWNNESQRNTIWNTRANNTKLYQNHWWQPIELTKLCFSDVHCSIECWRENFFNENKTSWNSYQSIRIFKLIHNVTFSLNQKRHISKDKLSWSVPNVRVFRIDCPEKCWVYVQVFIFRIFYALFFDIFVLDIIQVN